MLAAVVLLFIRCGSGDSAGSALNDKDADASATQDGSRSDSSAIPDTGGVALPRVLAVVHAAETFDFRVCFATSTAPDATTFDVGAGNPLPDDPRRPMPEANYPGVARGNATVVDPSIPSSGAYVVPFLVNALALTGAHAGDDCKTVLTCGGSSCIAQSDRVRLPALRRSDVTGSGTSLLAVVGKATKLTMRAIPVSGFPANVPEMGGQLAHLAPTLPSLTATYGRADGGASGAFATIGSASFGEASPPSHSLHRPDDRAMSGFASFGISLAFDTAGNDGGADASRADAGTGPNAPFFFASLADIQQASDPSRTPNELFEAGASFVFVVLGDPSVARVVDGGVNPEWSARGLHVVALRASAPEADAGNL